MFKAPAFTVISALGLSSALLVTVACDDGGFTQIPQPDGGVDAGPGPIPPEPPVFPLKAGDTVEVVVAGASVNDPCSLGEGFCDRAMTASYVIDDVYINEETNYWDIDATYFYEVTKADTTPQSFARLFYSKVVPFDDPQLEAEGTADTGSATFSTATAPTDEHMTPNGFPFFHYETEYANQNDSAFFKAANAFNDRIVEIDPEANIESQAANATIAAYFKDELGDPTFLHKVEVKYHPMGFLCNWDERVIPWVDGMQRSQGAFAGTTFAFAASWNSIRVVRDGTRYNCSCFTYNCNANVDGENVCLDPSDPEAPASAEACN